MGRESFPGRVMAAEVKGAAWRVAEFVSLGVRGGRSCRTRKRWPSIPSQGRQDVTYAIMAMIFERCRSYLGIEMSGPP